MKRFGMSGGAVWLLAGGLGVACGGDEAAPGVDGGDTTADVGPDVEMDVAPDAQPDVGVDDVADMMEPPKDVEVDTAMDAAADAGPDVVGGTLEASRGGACPLGERVAWVEIERMETDTARYYVNAWAQDRGHPAVGEPARVVGACLFYSAPNGCVGCDAGETCGVGDVCADFPVGQAGATVTLAGGAGSSQTLTTDTTGYAGDWVTASGDAFAVTVTLGDVTVVGPSIEVPGDLSDVTGLLTGDYDNPESVQNNWSGGAEDAAVFTHIPINHHVGGQTFTRCTVPAETGSMVADGTVLVPLAVSTGLEFQGIEHVRTATAATPAGCVEFRYLTRIYVPLF